MTRRTKYCTFRTSYSYRNRPISLHKIQLNFLSFLCLYRCRSDHISPKRLTIKICTGTTSSKPYSMKTLGSAKRSRDRRVMITSQASVSASRIQRIQRKSWRKSGVNCRGGGIGWYVPLFAIFSFSIFQGVVLYLVPESRVS